MRERCVRSAVTEQGGGGKQIIDIRAMLNDVTRLSHIDDTGDVRHSHLLNVNSYLDFSMYGLVVSALGIRARGPGFDSWVAPLFHLGKLFTHIASPVSQLQETPREFSAPKWL